MTEFSISGKTGAEEIIRTREETPAILEYAHESWQKDNFTDVTLKAGKVSLEAHRLILACFSNYFEDLFAGAKKKSKQVDVDVIEGNALKELVGYMYSGKIVINKENACNLLVGADHLKLENAKEFVLEYLESAITVDSCYSILTLAHKFNGEKLKEQAVVFCCNHFDDIANTMEFKSLKISDLKNFIDILDRGRLLNSSLFNGVVEWTNHKSDKRAKSFPELLPIIDLSHVPFSFLEEVVAKEPLVTNNHDCSKMLIQAFSTQTNELKAKETENDSKILSLGGRESRKKVVEVFYSSRASAKSYPDLPEERCASSAVKINGYVYCIGGLNSDHQCSKVVWRLNVQTDNLRWEEISPMLNARHIMGAAVFHNTLVVAGGWDEHGSLSSGEYYSEILNSWKHIHPMKHLRSGHALVAGKGSLYALGGFVHDGTHLRSVERLSAVHGDWKHVSSMSYIRFCFAAVNCGGYIYAIGGQAGKESHKRQNTAEKYNPDLNVWKTIKPMHFCRSGCHACALDGKIYVIGGVDKENTVVKDIECYNPENNEWVISGKTTDDLTDHALVAV